MKRLILCALAMAACIMCRAGYVAVESPDGRIAVGVSESGMSVSYCGQQVQQIDMQLAGLKQGKISKRNKVRYRMLSGKRLDCRNVSDDCTFSCDGSMLELKVFNDGIAFRTISGAPAVTFVVPDGTGRWAQALKTDYEGFYPYSRSAQRGNTGYPLLLEYSDGVFGLITEAGVGHGQSGSHLEWTDQGYKVTDTGAAVNAAATPWRVVILGSLADIVESTLVTDVSDPCRIDDTEWIRPGVSAWIYWAYNHSSKDFQKVKEYIDLAHAMHWPYNLIDWEWDEMANGGNIDDALEYAARKGVKANLWYNSGTSWIGPGAPGPQDRLRTAEAREKEMTRLEKLGATGIKVDFFNPDGPEMIDYYLDILEDAARHHLLVDFHGCTVPRGWSRTWPNLMSMESVYGAEWYNNNRRMTNAAPAHNATLPFTRNVVGPMDYTPCTFTDSQNPHITTDCHELALPILFESGLQHMADRPESYLGLPSDVRELLGGLPSAWDDTKLLDGYPGQSAVIARLSGKVWYVAGINGTDDDLTLTPDFSRLKAGRKAKVTLFQDKGNVPGCGFDIVKDAATPASLTIPAHGGFVMLIK